MTTFSEALVSLHIYRNLFGFVDEALRPKLTKALYQQ